MGKNMEEGEKEDEKQISIQHSNNQQALNMYRRLIRHHAKKT